MSVPRVSAPNPHPSSPIPLPSSRLDEWHFFLITTVLLIPFAFPNSRGLAQSSGPATNWSLHGERTRCQTSRLVGRAPLRTPARRGAHPQQGGPHALCALR